MKITIRVKPGAKQDFLERMSDGTFVVKVRAKAEDGKANEAVRELIADEFKISKSRIKILSPRSRIKIVEIE